MALKSRQILDKFRDALAEVHRDAATGQLDGSGRFYTDEELAQGAATGRSTPKPRSKSEGKTEDSAA